MAQPPSKRSQLDCKAASSLYDDPPQRVDDSPSTQQAHSSHPKIDAHKVYGGNVGFDKLNQIQIEAHVQHMSGGIIRAGSVHQHYYNQGKLEEKYEITKEEEQKLKDVLLERAYVESGKVESGIVSILTKNDAAIETQRLELVKVSDLSSNKRLDEEYHYNKRRDLIEIQSEPCNGDLNPEELFLRSLEEAKREAKSFSSTLEAFDDYVNRHGNIVAVIGQAGIGKTTLARKMAQLVLQKKILPDIQYIFYIPYREINFAVDCSLFSLMMTGCYKWKHTPISDEAWEEKLQDDPNVAFIFDGLDEANTGQLYVTNYLGSNSNTVFYLRKILSGDIFPRAVKLITSRPKQIFQLDVKLRPRFVVNILGLSSDAQENIGRQICGDSFTLVQEYLTAHPDIAGLLYVPVQCIITFGVLCSSVKEKGKISILSFTDLFVQALLMFIASDHLRGKGDEVWKLSDLAWVSFLSRKIIFTQESFTNADINADAFQAFLVTTTTANIRFSILSGRKLISFTHLTWHELFTALNAIFLLSVDELNFHLYNLNYPLWEVVSKFMFGLCNPSVNKKVKCIFPPDKVKDLNEKKKLLHEHALTVLKRDGEDSDSFLQVCRWIYEAGDPKLTDKAAACLPDKIQLEPQYIKISPSDVTSLICVLKRTTKPIAIEYVSSSCFVQDGLQRLLKGIAKLSVTVDYIDLSYNDMNDDEVVASLVDALHNVKKVDLKDCNMSKHAINGILTKVASLAHLMEDIDLSNNNMDDDEVVASLIDALHNVKEIELTQCNLSKHAINEIWKKVASLPHPMECINLSYNDMDDDEVVASLIGAVHNVKRIYLNNCNLSKHARNEISKKVASLPHSMEDIDLNSNDMDDDEVVATVDGALHKGKDIFLRPCNLSKHAIKEISKKIASFPHPVDYIDLSCNDLNDDEAVASLVDALHNVKKVDLNNCNMSKHAINGILTKVSSLAHPMEKINLMCNDMNDDEVVALLVGALHKVKNIILSQCNLSKYAINEIWKKVAFLPHPMEYINLSYNDMDDDEVVASLVGALHNVKTIYLRGCNLNKHALNHIREKVSSLAHSRPTVLGLIDQHFPYD